MLSVAGVHTRISLLVFVISVVELHRNPLLVKHACLDL